MARTVVGLTEDRDEADGVVRESGSLALESPRLQQEKKIALEASRQQQSAYFDR
jgi:hypothetical protein